MNRHNRERLIRFTKKHHNNNHQATNKNYYPNKIKRENGETFKMKEPKDAVL